MNNIKPILFSTPMVKATLEGRKTQTRRVVNPQPINVNYWTRHENALYPNTTNAEPKLLKPKYLIGDILWVRETWVNLYDTYFYRADVDKCVEELMEPHGVGWRPSIHMPKEVARIFLRVKDVYAEHVQDITEESAISEGVIPSMWDIANESYGYVKSKYIRAFQGLWYKTYTKQGCRWEDNPWVWAYVFEKLDTKESNKYYWELVAPKRKELLKAICESHRLHESMKGLSDEEKTNMGDCNNIDT